MSKNIIILVILISLVKYFPSIFAREHRLKVEPVISSVLMWFYCLNISQFHFTWVSTSPITFLTVVSELLVVFLESGTIHVNGTTYMTLFTYTVLFTRNGGSNPRVLWYKVGNNGVSKVIGWFCTRLGKFCRRGDKSLKSLGFKWDRCDASSLSWELS